MIGSQQTHKRMAQVFMVAKTGSSHSNADFKGVRGKRRMCEEVMKLLVSSDQLSVALS